MTHLYVCAMTAPVTWLWYGYKQQCTLYQNFQNLNNLERSAEYLKSCPFIYYNIFINSFFPKVPSIKDVRSEGWGVCEQKWTTMDGGGVAIDRTSTNAICFGISEFVSVSNTSPPIHDVRIETFLGFGRLRATQIGRPWTGGEGGVISMLDKGGGPKSHCLLGRLW